MARKKDLWLAFVDLEKAFDRVPCEVVWWALKCLEGVDEWIVSVMKAMFEDATTTVRVNGRESGAFRKLSEDFCNLLGIQCVADVVGHGRLRWTGHLE